MPVQATQVRLRFVLPNGVEARPGFFLGGIGGSAPVPLSELQALADDTRAAVVSSGLMAGFTTGVLFEQAEAQNFEVAPPGTFEPPPNPNGKLRALTVTFQSSGAAVAGTIADDTLPPQNSAVYSQRTATPGPKGRGRMFLPPLAEGEVNSTGLIDTGRQTQLNTDILAVIVAAIASPTVAPDWVVVSRKHDELFAVTGAAMNAIIRTQRPRYTR